MTRDTRLILFDVDGTLVDSQASIMGAMTSAFETVGLPVPQRDTILSIVGLSLDHAMPRLAPTAQAKTHAQLVDAYRNSFFTQRTAHGAAALSPLFPGARDLLDSLSAAPENILGVATGKSVRGLNALIKAHGLTDMFVTCQTADHHPSKPNPSMVLTAMAEAGIDPSATIVVGDTSYDMEMAQAACARAVGVGWGYHPVAELARHTDTIAADFDDLTRILQNETSAAS